MTFFPRINEAFSVLLEKHCFHYFLIAPLLSHLTPEPRLADVTTSLLKTSVLEHFIPPSVE